MQNHLFIGLGGQGNRTLAELLRVMEQRAIDTAQLAQNNTQVAFLAIDSSRDVKDHLPYWSYFGKDLSLQPADWVMMDQPNDGNISGLILQPSIAPWIGNANSIKSFIRQGGMVGANQRRRFGRLLFAFNAITVQAALTNKVAALVDGGKQECAFHLFATLAGGTGSGTLVDMVAMIRSQYPNDGGQNYPIYVHVYITDSDATGANVGYFFQNQYAALRDLNALICGQLQPHLLGNSAAGTFASMKPINQVVITAPVNSQQIATDLDHQIRLVAEATLERIYALSSGQLTPNAQKAITGEDTVNVFPGEPLQNPDRSYRFGGFGIRRWEVPQAKLEELAALDLLRSGLLQQLFDHWQDKNGFVATLPASDSRPDAVLQNLAACIAKHRTAKILAKELPATLAAELKQQTEKLLKQDDGVGSQTLSKLEQHLKEYYATHFQERGAATLIGDEKQAIAQQRVQAGLVDLAQELTHLWKGASLPLAQMGSAIDLLDQELAKETQPTSDYSTLITAKQRQVSSRMAEWEKLTWLSSPLMQRPLIDAHLADLSAHYQLALQRDLEAVDQQFIQALRNALGPLKKQCNQAQQVLQNQLAAITKERDLIKNDLQQLATNGGSNNYEIDFTDVDAFLDWMRQQKKDQQGSAMLLKTEILQLCANGLLTQLDNAANNNKRHLESVIKRAALAQVTTLHTGYTNQGGTPILHKSLLDRLEQRHNKDPQTFIQEVKAFVDKAAVCFPPRKDTQPVTVLGGNAVGIPTMPKRCLVLGVPNHSFANTIRQAFLNNLPAGAGYVVDTYTHSDPTQVRLLAMDYWLAARFIDTLGKLEQLYDQGTQGLGGQGTRYFCNIDPEGEAGRRHSLFLPSAGEMRLRYEGELWLGQRPQLAVLKEDPNGLFCIHPADGGPQVVRLANSVEDALATANFQAMFTVHHLVQQARASLPSKVLNDLLAKRSDALIKEFGQTSPEYLHWQAVRALL